MRSPITMVLALAIVAACSEGAIEPGPKSCCEDEVGAADLPATSVYQLTSKWTDQEGAVRALPDFRGDVVLTAMIFTNCRYACPRIISDLQAIEAGLSPLHKPRVRFVLVTLDVERDTTDVLREFARENELGARWTLLRGAAGDVRELAAVLGVRYKQAESGDFSHSNLITVLGRDGAIVHRQQGLEVDPAATLVAIRAALE